MNPTRKKRMRTVALTVCLALVLQLTGCGTLIHPDRRGQDGGRIDPAIAVLDGLGLLLFVVPGLVAFAIDFSTGAIYLPGTDTASTPNANNPGTDARVVHVNSETVDLETISRVVREETGLTVNLEDERVDAYRYPDRELMLARLTEINHVIASDRIMGRTRQSALAVMCVNKIRCCATTSHSLRRVSRHQREYSDNTGLGLAILDQAVVLVADGCVASPVT